MTHLNVDAAELQLASQRDCQRANTWAFGFVCGAVLVYVYYGGSPWTVAGAVVVGVVTLLQNESVVAAQRVVDLARARRDEWRHERIVELHEEELAEYRDTIAVLRKELAQRDPTIN